MWRFYLLALVILFPLLSFAQSKRLDSLLVVLTTATPASYTPVFSQLEQALVETDYTSALKAVEEMFSISQQLPFKGPLSSAYRCKAIVYNTNKDRMQAIQNAQKAYTLAKNYKLPIQEATSLRLLGDIFRTLGKDEVALDYFLKALEIFRQQGHQKSEAEILYELGNLCYATHKYNASRRYLLKSYELGRDSLPSRLLISTINTIALTHRAKDEFSQAISYQKLSHQMAFLAKDSSWIGITAGNLGKIYDLQNKDQQAIPYYQLDIRLSKKFNMWGSVANSYISLADIHLQQKNYGAAKLYLDSAMRLTGSVKENELNQTLYKSLSEYYYQTNQLNKAYAYQNLYYKQKDSLDKRKYNAALEKVMAEYEWDKKQAEIELLKKDNQLIQAEAQRKNFTLYTITALLLFILILAFILYRNNHQKKKANQILTLQQQELSGKNEQIKQFNNSLEQKVDERTHQLQVAMENLVKKNQHLEDFAYVISHNLRAPIARIMGLISIFNKENLSDQNNLAILQHLHTSAVNLDIVVSGLNDVLSMQNLTDTHKEEVLLEDVTQLTLESLYEEIKTSSATIQTDYTQVDRLLSIKSYITSILYNLLSNAIKYKSPERSPQIFIKATRIRDFICLTIKDNGLGLDLVQINSKKLFKLYQRIHTHVEGKGMGLYIVKEQVEALNGKIEVESMPNQGCTFYIYLPA
jgi:signal transduction histidine kinase